MARKSVAALLVAFWVVLSAIDLLKSLDLATHSKVSSTKTSSPDLGRSSRARNIAVENANQIVRAEVSLTTALACRNGRFHLSATETNGAREPDVPKKNRKIYKLYGTFLL